MAKDVNLVSVRVLDCNGSGTVGGVVAGIDWVTANACKYSPARVAEAITVSATASNDAKPSWANYGNCVDWFAPGVSITSAWYTSNTALATISGTSMAAPHVAGAVALYFETAPQATPQQAYDFLHDETTKNIVTNWRTTNNHLLFTLWGDTPPPPPGDEIGLSAFGYKIRGRQHADLSWTGATSAEMYVYRNGNLIATVPNNGAYTDAIGAVGGGSYIYQICEVGTSACSNTVTVSF